MDNLCSWIEETRNQYEEIGKKLFGVHHESLVAMKRLTRKRPREVIDITSELPQTQPEKRNVHTTNIPFLQNSVLLYFSD